MILVPDIGIGMALYGGATWAASRYWPVTVLLAGGMFLASRQSQNKFVRGAGVVVPAVMIGFMINGMVNPAFKPAGQTVG